MATFVAPDHATISSMFLLPEGSWEVHTTEHGRGIFTSKDIAPGTVIGDYLGPLVADKDDESHKKGDDHFYTMYFDDGVSVEPSGDVPGIHFINHSCTPNTWMYTYHGHTLYFALRKIFKGEELTVSYQISPVDEDCNPCEHLCTCGSIICKGTMHLSQEQYNKWVALEEKEDKSTTREKAAVGTMLKRLIQYPRLFPDHPLYTLFGNPKHPPLLNQARSLPSIDEIRLLLRDTGRIIELPLINMRIFGVINECIVSISLT